MPAPVGCCPRRRRSAFGMVGTLLLSALLLVLSVGGLRGRLLGEVDPVRVRSLAVLPLENLSGDASQDYFADGMTEALTTDLAKLGELRVMSRSSVMRYKGAPPFLPEVGRALNVDALLTGSVVRSGERVRFAVQLVHAATDRNLLWADSYERDLRDVLALQREVASDVAGGVRIKLTPRRALYQHAGGTGGLSRPGTDGGGQDQVSAIERGKGYGHFHHTAYHIACAYARMSKPEQAMKWLEVAAQDGFPCYPLFEKDTNLDSLRRDTRFASFLANLRQRSESY